MNRTCSLLVVATLLLAACSKPEDKFVGQYDGTMEFSRELLDRMKANISDAGGDWDAVEAKLSSRPWAMELRADGTCTMSQETDGKPAWTEGTWTLNEEGTLIILRLPVAFENAADMGYHNPDGDIAVLKISEDGRTLSAEGAEQGSTSKVTFTRR